MKITWIIYRNILLLHAALFSPLLMEPRSYLMLMGLFALCGLPAFPFFSAVFSLVRRLSSRRSFTAATVATFCLPAICMITALCASLAASIVLASASDSYSYHPALCAFGILAVIQAAAILFNRSEDLHKIIYPHLYATDTKETAA